MRGKILIIILLCLIPAVNCLATKPDKNTTEWVTNDVLKEIDTSDAKEFSDQVEKDGIKQKYYNEAKELSDYTKQKDFLDKIEKYFIDIQEDFAVDGHYSDFQKTNISKPSDILGSKIYIFISSSVPNETIRNYVKFVVKHGLEKDVVFVLRGFVGNDISKIKPTMEYINQLIKIDPGCDVLRNRCEIYKVDIIIDPLLFARLSVKHVPAVAVISNIKTLDETQSIGKTDNASFEYVVVYGDSNLRYLLDRLYEETKDINVKKYIEKIGG